MKKWFNDKGWWPPVLLFIASICFFRAAILGDGEIILPAARWHALGMYFIGLVAGCILWRKQRDSSHASS